MRAAGGTRVPLMLDWLIWLSIPNVNAEWEKPAGAHGRWGGRVGFHEQAPLGGQTHLTSTRQGGAVMLTGRPASGVGGVPEADGRPRCDCMEQLVKKQRFKKKKKKKAPFQCHYYYLNKETTYLKKKFFLATKCHEWDLSSRTRDRTRGPTAPPH